MKKIKLKNNIYYYEVSIKPYVDTVGITVYMWKQHRFETILTSDDVLNIQDSIGKGFVSTERALSTGVNSYFGPKKKTDHIQLLPMDLGNKSFKLIFTDKHIFCLKTCSYTRKMGINPVNM